MIEHFTIEIAVEKIKINLKLQYKIHNLLFREIKLERNVSFQKIKVTKYYKLDKLRSLNVVLETPK